MVWWNHYRETSTSLHSKPRAQEVKEILDEIQIEIETNRNATRNQETISVGQARIKRWFCMGFEKLPDFLFSLRLQKFFVTKQPVISFRLYKLSGITRDTYLTLTCFWLMMSIEKCRLWSYQLSKSSGVTEAIFQITQNLSLRKSLICPSTFRSRKFLLFLHSEKGSCIKNALVFKMLETS